MQHLPATQIMSLEKSVAKALIPVWKKSKINYLGHVLFGKCQFILLRCRGRRIPRSTLNNDSVIMWSVLIFVVWQCTWRCAKAPRAFGATSPLLRLRHLAFDENRHHWWEIFSFFGATIWLWFLDLVSWLLFALAICSLIFLPALGGMFSRLACPTRRCLEAGNISDGSFGLALARRLRASTWLGSAHKLSDFEPERWETGDSESARVLLILTGFTDNAAKRLKMSSKRGNINGMISLSKTCILRSPTDFSLDVDSSWQRRPRPKDSCLQNQIMHKNDQILSEHWINIKIINATIEWTISSLDHINAFIISKIPWHLQQIFAHENYNADRRNGNVSSCRKSTHWDSLIGMPFVTAAVHRATSCVCVHHEIRLPDNVVTAGKSDNRTIFSRPV